MKRTLIPGAMACTLLATTALTAPVLAQAPPPPVNHNIDGNGVDVVLGQFGFSQDLLSIGPDWPHGLRYTRMTSEIGWLDNYTGGIHQLGTTVYISIGNTSAKFIYSGGVNLYNSGTFSPDHADGSTLTRSGGVFTYTNRRGEIVRFTSEIVHPGRIVEGTGRVVDLQFPNGAVITPNYRTENVCDEFGENCRIRFRIQSVTNNFNYQLRYAYAQNTVANDTDLAEWQRLVSVKAINTAVEACNAFADSCSLSNPWPTVSFGTSGSDETVTLPDSSVWRLTPTGFGVGAIRRPGSTSDDIAIAYDGYGRVQSVTGAAGTWTYGYSDSGTTRTTTIAGPLSIGRVVTSDLDNLIITADQNALGQTTAYQYDSNDRLTRITAPEGNYTSYTYDGRGNVTEVRHVAKSGSGLFDIVVTATFPSSCTYGVTCNQPTSVTDSRGNVSDFTYDTTHGGLLTATAPAPTSGAVRPQTRVGYTSSTVGGVTVRLPSSISRCQITSSCNAVGDEVLTTVSYSGSNFLPTSVTSGNGSGTLTATRSIAYDDIGNVQAVDGPLSGSADTTRYRYNALRQPIGTIGPDPDGSGGGNPLLHRARRITYDAAGLPSATETGTVNSQSDGDWAAFSAFEGRAVERDSLGRPIVRRLVSGATTYELTQTSYDAAGRVQCSAQRMNPGEFANASLPADACTLDTQGTGANDFGPDRIVRIYYDAVGRVTQVRGAYAVSGQEANEASTTYTTNGQLSTLTDAMGNLTTYVYDGHDRLSQSQFPSVTQGAGASNSSDYEQLTYVTATVGGSSRSTPLVASVRRRNGSNVAFSYDNLNRVVLRDRPNAISWELDDAYSYDNLNRLISTNDSYGHTFTFSYDALGRRLSETDNWLGTTSFSWDIVGRRTRMTWRDSNYVDYVYDVADDMIEIRENGSTSGAGLLAVFAYDNRGRRTSLGRGNGTSTTYTYDNVDRLTVLSHDLASSSGDVSYTHGYNPAGQITSTVRSNDSYASTSHYAVNRNYTTNGRNQYTAAGSASFGYDSNGNLSSDGTHSYSYDVDNRLSYLHGQLYDPLGRLFVGGGSTAFIYDGQEATAEADPTYGTIQRRYVFGPGGDEPLVWYEGTGLSTRSYFYADERGSVVAVSDGSGALAGINRYDEYGLPQGPSGAGTLYGRFGYTGQAWIPELGLYHYRARTYSPTLGRFLQTDPIGYGDGMNMYAYVGNDPVNFTDPLGLEDITVTGPCMRCDDEPGDPGGEAGFRRTGMVASPTISENQDSDIVVTAIPMPRSNRLTSMIVTAALQGDIIITESRRRNPGPRISEDEREAAAEADYAQCRQLTGEAARLCWESAAQRDAARTWGRPMDDLNTGERVALVVAGVILYWVISEGSRILFPPRNLIPVP